MLSIPFEVFASKSTLSIGTAQWLENRLKTLVRRPHERNLYE
jgi:hypothetical protein